MHPHWRPLSWMQGRGPVAGNVQTIWPALFSRHWHEPVHRLTGRRQRWLTPDGDFIDADWLAEPPRSDSPLLVVFHGLEGSSRSHYAQAFAHWARTQGWGCVVPHWRGCSGEVNWQPRAYHSGDHEELHWMLERLQEAHPHGPKVAAGISLGGNVLLRWAQEQGAAGTRWLQAVAAVSAPLDLSAAGHAIGAGFNRQVYNRMFLSTLKAKALQRLQRHPGLVDAQALKQAPDIYTFDNLVTAPLHGFRNTDDYWTRCSSAPRLKGMTGMPALVLNALNDPFIPASSLPGANVASEWVTLWRPAEGGHVGFPGGRGRGHVADMPAAVGQWLAMHLPMP